MSKPKYSFENAVLLFVIFSAIGVSFYYTAGDLKEKVAFKGEGPQAYVNFKTKPQNFEKDWNFQFNSAQDFMLATKCYLYLKRNFGIDPSKAMYIQVLLQFLLIAFGSAFLSYTLFRNKIVATISAISVLITDILSLNLSRHGPSLEIPGYSGIPIGLMIFAICFFLRNRYFVTFLLSALTAYFYVNLGGMLIIFVLSYLFARPKLVIEKSFLSGFLLYILFMVPYVYLILANSAVLVSDIPRDKWVYLTRMFSFHWYPSALYSFIPYYLTPMLFLCMLFFLSLSHIDIKGEKHQKILIGFISVVLMTLTGVFFAEVHPTPFFIKICLHKSTMLISVISFLYIINYLYLKIISDSPLFVFIALLTLLLPFFSKFGIAFLPLLLLSLSDIKSENIGLISLK